MKAGFWESIGNLKLMDVPVPPVGPEEVKIKVAYCGICDNDIFIRDGHFSPLQPPMILGHEFAGTIAEVGKKVTQFKVGQRVACNMQVFCGHCFYCHNGFENFCDNVTQATGAFAEYCVVSQNALELMPDDMTFEKASFLELTAAAMWAVIRTEVVMGRNVAILGGGSKSQMEVMLCRLNGASKVMVVEPNASRREIALRSGADIVVDPAKEDVKKIAMEVTGGHGFDHVIESSADVANCKLALEIASKCAVVNWAANYYMNDKVEVDLFLIRHKGLKIHTSIQSPYLFERSMCLLPRLDVESLITAVYPLDKLQEAFDLQAKNEALKILIKP